MNSVKISQKNIIAIFAFLFPIIPLYFQIAGINGINVLSALFILGVLIVKGTKVNLKLSLSAITIVVLIWVICRCASFVVSGDFTEIIYFLLRTVGVFYALNKIVSKRSYFLTMIKAVVYSSFFVSFFGIVEAVTHFNIFSLLNTTGELNYNPLRFGLLRILSFSSHTIVYGIYLMFAMSLCLYFMQFVKNSKRQYRVFQIGYILIWINMLLTVSRSSIIAAIVSQLLILYFSGARRFFKNLLKIIVVAAVAMVLLSLAVPKVADMITNVWYMILAILNEDYTSLISSSFGEDNLGGVGNRVDLYAWVAEEMRGHWLLGHGMSAEFSHSYSATNGLYYWIAHKTSIEVQYLDVLYRYGLVGMVTEIAVYIGLLISAIRNRVSKKEWEPTVGFNGVAFAVFACYFAAMFAVNQSSDRNIFYLFTMIFLLYNKNKNKFTMEETE